MCGAWIALVLTAVTVTACGSSRAPAFGTAAIARAIATSIANAHHLRSAVRCPPSVPRRAGFVFACAASLDVGTYPVLVTVTSARGRVRYENPAPLVVLDTAKVRRAIARSILQQRRVRASVRCPAEVIQQEGVAFKCAATVGGRALPFSVMQVDGSGDVRYLGER
jgi:hypothetical protein